MNEGENCKLDEATGLADLGVLACLNKANANKEQACSRTPRDENTKCVKDVCMGKENISGFKYPNLSEIRL